MAAGRLWLAALSVRSSPVPISSVQVLIRLFPNPCLRARLRAGVMCDFALNPHPTPLDPLPPVVRTRQAVCTNFPGSSLVADPFDGPKGGLFPRPIWLKTTRSAAPQRAPKSKVNKSNNYKGPTVGRPAGQRDPDPDHSPRQPEPTHRLSAVSLGLRLLA